jgi:hypothetical protein
LSPFFQAAQESDEVKDARWADAGSRSAIAGVTSATSSALLKI